jgi:hypothetical protein
MDMALYYLKNTGEFDAAVREWEAKPIAKQTWANIKTFMATEYAKENKQNKLSAKQFKANAIKEQAEATEELIAHLTEAHTCQMETLIKSTTKAMKEMLNLVNETTNQRQATQTATKRKRNVEKNKTNTAMHQSVNTAKGNTHPNQKMSAGSWRSTHHPAQQCGNPGRAPEGVRGPK